MKTIYKILIFICLISNNQALNTMHHDDDATIRSMEEGRLSTDNPRQNVNSKCFCCKTEDEIIRDLDCERTFGREGAQQAYSFGLICGGYICFGLIYAIIKASTNLYN